MSRPKNQTREPKREKILKMILPNNQKKKSRDEKLRSATRRGKNENVKFDDAAVVYD